MASCWLTLDGGQSLYDMFHFKWTLLRLGSGAPSGDGFVHAARQLHVYLEIVDGPSNDALEIYEAPLVLIRPDQVVAWRGVNDASSQAVLAVATGHRAKHNPIGMSDESIVHASRARYSRRVW